MYATNGEVEEVAATRMTANTQCRKSAVRGLSSRALSIDELSRCLSKAYGVVVLLAKKRENGRIPSLAISCFTDTQKDISPAFIISGPPYLVMP